MFFILKKNDFLNQKMFKKSAMIRQGVDDEKVICKLVVTEVSRYNKGDSCNVHFKTPNGCGVGFVIDNPEDFPIGTEVYAIGTNTHVTTAACHYQLIPFWNGD